MHYCSRHALLGQASEGESIKAAQTALSDESQELQKLRQVIQQLRATSSSQRETIQEMQKTVAAAGGKLMNLSVELNALRHSNDDLFRVAADQEKTLLSVENSLTDVKRDLQLVEDTMLRSGLRPK